MLYSSSAEVALLKDKEVLLKYIEKWRLYPSSEVMIFSLLKQKEKVKEPHHLKMGALNGG